MTPFLPASSGFWLALLQVEAGKGLEMRKLVLSGFLASEEIYINQLEALLLVSMGVGRWGCPCQPMPCFKTALGVGEDHRGQTPTFLCSQPGIWRTESATVASPGPSCDRRGKDTPVWEDKHSYPLICRDDCGIGS